MTLESSKKWKIQGKLGDNDDVISLLLEKRGISRKEKKGYLDPSFDQIPSWKKLYGATEAAEKILEAIETGKKIFIHGDFDVDGVSATAILWEFLYYELSEKVGKKIDVMPYIPDRVDEGYGLSKSSLDSMIANGAALVVTVDCGVRDRLLIEEYIKKNDIDIIITDHHQPPDDISEVKYTVVHQMFPGKEFPETKICGTAVIFLVIQALKAKVGIDDNLTVNTKGLDLVGLATVGDMMSLIGINRVFVKYGIEQMKMGKRKGLKSLIELAGINLPDLDSYHLGFVIGPRINAAGRIGNVMDSLKLLVSSDSKLISELSAKLHNLNILRQENTSNIFEVASNQIEEGMDDMLLVAYGDDWHEGVIGLVASKLLVRYGKPVVVMTKTSSGEIKGSARSLPFLNITKALELNSKYLERYGGHSQAAGFTLKEGALEEFKKRLVKYASDNISPDLLEDILEVDLKLDIESIDAELVEKLGLLKPFGYGNPKPVFCVEQMKVTDKYKMSNGKHMKLKLQKNGINISAVMFNCDEDIEKIALGDELDLACYIEINEYNGYRDIQLQIKEWKR